MAFHRCTETFVVGITDDQDITYHAGRAYDDGDKNHAASIARFPEKFDSPEKTK